ncbi:Von Ebner gland protein 2 [Microtus ochrogaster]|uniref:von Ebner gland protein 2 n=1 Tax=Microtus ochrogaster TaxID=79684 RepID=A0A8J6GEI7_MICOH|nr:Von Ebner gland protein 2 [Microtus ochrogaster]
MKTLILCLGLGLVAALQAQAFPATEENIDPSGTWYLKATASDKEIPGLDLRSMSVTPMTITTLEGGNLQVNFTVLIEGRCHEMNTVLEKTSVPIKYTAYGGTQEVYIISSAVEGHYIFYWKNNIQGEQFRIVKLVGRDPDFHQEALEDFQNAVKAGGLNTESILIPRQSDNGLSWAELKSGSIIRKGTEMMDL